jgi:hypothetical protein
MKQKFWLFMGDNYYPESGLGDYKGAFDCVHDARDAVPCYRGDWWTILTSDERGELIEVISAYWNGKEQKFSEVIL